MADLLREVDDAVRAENMKRLWDEHKTALIAGIAALILGTAAFSMWNSWNLDRNQKQTSEILAALDAKDAPASLEAVAKKQSGNGAAIAYLNAASLELKKGEKQKALEAYTKAQESKKSDAVFRDLGALQKVNLLLDLKPDTKPEDLLKDLSPIAGSKNSPWQGEAVFMTAFIKGEKLQDYASASKDLQGLSDRPDITESIKQRAQALQSVYDLKLQEKK